MVNLVDLRGHSKEGLQSCFFAAVISDYVDVNQTALISQEKNHQLSMDSEDFMTSRWLLDIG